MTSAGTQPAQSEPAVQLPDYLTDPNAVLKDSHAKWRYGRAPDYSKTRKVYYETKKMSHAAGSLEQLVENLVKNWEVEASFKPTLADWRTIDPEKYSFAINAGEPQPAEHMLKVGTYNAVIAPNEYYDPTYSDFASSHKTFKRMMPTFAWEVLEVYSGPPQVAFRWRHWGVMKNGYVGLNNKGEKVRVAAHGGPIDIEGVTVATVDDKTRLQQVRTWFDPMDMFRQIVQQGAVSKQKVSSEVSPSEALDEPLMQDPAPKYVAQPDGQSVEGEFDNKKRQNVALDLEQKDTSYLEQDNILPSGHPAVSQDLGLQEAMAACPFASRAVVRSETDEVSPAGTTSHNEAERSKGNSCESFNEADIPYMRLAGLKIISPSEVELPKTRPSSSGSSDCTRVSFASPIDASGRGSPADENALIPDLEQQKNECDTCSNDSTIYEPDESPATTDDTSKDPSEQQKGDADTFPADSATRELEKVSTEVDIAATEALKEQQTDHDLSTSDSNATAGVDQRSRFESIFSKSIFPF